METMKKRSSRTTRLYDGLRGDPRGRGERSRDLTQRGVKEVNLRADLRNPRPIFISSQLSAQENEQLLELLKKYVDVSAWTYDEMLGLDPRLVVHSLHVNPGTKPVFHLVRIFHTEVEAQIT